ncbi:MAG TPA: hypothetical protein VFF11_02125, partial [Candidatus Binatia bacterium]|nr:hypothetical protein [Candidatus Binatia bacterium]
MKLAEVKDGSGVSNSLVAQATLAMDTPASRAHGRTVWLANCAICHSSKQPDGFALSFERKIKGEEWNAEPAPKDAKYVLPMDAADWTAYKQSPNYRDYTNRLWKLVLKGGGLDGDPLTDNHPFWQDNYLSTDIRVPVTLVGTPTGRALASNGLTNHVWDNFTSITYKELPDVGDISYFDSISGTNAIFHAPGGGRGYYRPASLVSLWATAPYLHNNALGAFLNDPSTKGRLVQFYDGIRRLLWSSKRASPHLVMSPREWEWLNKVQDDEQKDGRNGSVLETNTIVTHPGDLRLKNMAAAMKDPGFIYRLPNDTSIQFAPGFIRPLVEGLAGPALTKFLTCWLWVILAVISILLAWAGKPRYLGLVLLAVAGLVGLPLVVTWFGGARSVFGMFLMTAAFMLPFTIYGWIVVTVSYGAAGILCIQSQPGANSSTRGVLATLLGGTG